MKNVNFLIVSDWIEPLIYSEMMKHRMKDVDIIISCGDLSFSYLDFIMSELNKPLLFVAGNHVSSRERARDFHFKNKLLTPSCFTNLHLKCYNIEQILLTGFEGCNWYNGGPFQYKQWEVYLKLFGLIPRMIYNKIRYGRYIDIFVAHSAPAGVGDRPDLPHNGFKAFNWFIKWFKPTYFLHGHVHRYDNNESRIIEYEKTKVINCTGFYNFVAEISGENNSSKK